MPADLNRVALIGRLTRDPELYRPAGGEPVCHLRLAVASRARASGDGWEDRANYFDVALFGGAAEGAAEHLAKGRRVAVDGRLSWREHQGRDGRTRQSVEVVATALFYLDAPRDTAPADARPMPRRPARAAL